MAYKIGAIVGNSADSRVLITGASGQLGFAVTKALEAEGFDPLALSRRDLDITGKKDIDEAFARLAPDVVINCAAFTDVDACEELVEEAFRVNCLGPALLAAAARRAGARLVHVSTDYVFDGEKGSPYSEGDRPNPVNVYGASKLAGELAVSSQLEDYAIVRVAALFGPLEKGARRGNFVDAIAEKALAAGGLRVVDDQRVSPTCASFAAETIAGLVGAGARGVFHAAGGEPATWFEFAGAIVEELGAGARVEPIPSEGLGRQAKRPRDTTLSSERLADAGVSPPRSFREGLAAYLRSVGYLT